MQLFALSTKNNYATPILSFLFSISNSLCYKYVISNTILHYTAFLIYTRYKYESVSASLEEQKEIELNLI